ncbi:MAG TPA: hypothetical protein VJ508_08925, partial [Saprospiraceae bacterium]|nr:hypothetical protein [Saprospiraceae bacterium]
RNRMKIILSAGIVWLISFWCIMAWLNDPERLAINSYHHTAHMMLSSNVYPEVKDLFRQGDLAFEKKEFQKAIFFFSTYLKGGTDDNSRYAHWFILLCRLAWKGADDTWRQDMIMFLKTAPPSLQREGQYLLRTCSSPIFRIMHGQKLQRAFSLIKPNII